MKAILEFDLSDADDLRHHKECVAANSIVIAIWEFDQKLREIVKYNEHESEQFIDGVDKARSLLREILDENDLTNLVLEG